MKSVIFTLKLFLFLHNDTTSQSFKNSLFDFFLKISESPNHNLVIIFTTVYPNRNCLVKVFREAKFKFFFTVKRCQAPKHQFIKRGGLSEKASASKGRWSGEKGGSSSGV